MLQIENRLKKDRDFNLLMKNGRWVNGRILDLKVLFLEKQVDLFPKKVEPAEFSKQLKVAFSVGLKFSKSAVVRNRLRRQISEVVRLLIKEEKIKSGVFLLFVAKKEAFKEEYEIVSKEVVSLFKKAGVLK